MAVKFTFQSVFGNSGQNPRHFSAWGREESLGLYSILWSDWPTSKQKILRHWIVLPLGFADAIFGRERSDDRKCVCGSQARIRRCASRPTKFMGKTVTVPHFNSDTVEFASRKRDESNPRIQTLLPFLKKHYGRERFGEFSRSHSGLRCLLLASQDNFNKFIAIRRRSCDLADFERRLISCFS